ncbi:hypothetical protein P7D08_26250 [Bacillus pacificus]|uniref:hypothetical protein n=1 Tax=Bacillus pacificus TaxID=2026187 RepID=UPI00240E069F|nr:hypothetical protein [Bacillus pacificus]MDG1651678.1 hypothetical protein [Bacillus pacificus]
MKFLGEKLLKKWIAIPREIRIISLFFIVAIIFFIMFFLPGIKTIKILFTDFNKIGITNLIIAVIGSILILVIFKTTRKK